VKEKRHYPKREEDAGGGKAVRLGRQEGKYPVRVGKRGVKKKEGVASTAGQWGIKERERN